MDSYDGKQHFLAKFAVVGDYGWAEGHTYIHDRQGV